MFCFFKHFFRNIAIFTIKLYQRTLSPDHGLFSYLFPYGYCRFSPTCSNYAISAIKKYGLFRGGVKTGWRILRCNPFNKGGHDPV